jgi:hypothetical protein
MARIPPQNPRYRTKQQLAHDVAKVLKSNLHYGTKFAVLKEVMWVWTEFDGKFRGCIYWSQAAIRRFRHDGHVKNLRHEHIVPKKVVMDRLFRLKKPTTKRVWRILDRFLIGVIVTKKEDARLNAAYSKAMPASFRDKRSPGFRDPWLRYRECGIRVRVFAHQRAAILKPFARIVSRKTNSELAIQRLERALYRHGWIDSNFNWASWPEAEQLLSQPELVSQADIFTIRKLLTLHFRQERFCEGHLAEQISNGHFQRLLRRLRQLRICWAFE